MGYKGIVDNKYTEQLVHENSRQKEINDDSRLSRLPLYCARHFAGWFFDCYRQPFGVAIMTRLSSVTLPIAYACFILAFIADERAILPLFLAGCFSLTAAILAILTND